MIKHHSCTKKFDGGHTETCVEEKDFTLWWDNAAERRQVDFCPLCGFKATIKVGEPPHVHRNASQSMFGRNMQADIDSGKMSRECAEAFRNVIDKIWEEDVINNPHIQRLHGTFMDPNVTSDRAKLLSGVAISEALSEEDEQVVADRAAKQVKAMKKQDDEEKQGAKDMSATE